MYQPLNSNEFKQRVAEYFDQRTEYDEEGTFHPRIAHRLVEYANLSGDQTVLDVATGTGLAAIAAAQQLAPEGWVVGVDLSVGMLEQAKRKIEALKLGNITLQVGDAEALRFSDNTFDVVLCSSALIYLTDIPKALQCWYRCLKPGGRIGFHGFSEDAFIAGVLTQKVAQRYGVPLTFNQPTGTPEKCYALLQAAGFTTIKIHTEQFGDYLSLEAAERLWNPVSINPMVHPLRQLSPQQLEQARDHYVAELKTLVSDRGIWNDITTFFCFGQKPGARS
jgi:ubiquinone/menaquinone biosynthesis C-methylase UbiE